MNSAVHHAINAAPISEFTAELHKKAAKMGVNIDRQQLSLLGMYYQELVFWNRLINLVSERSMGEIIERHFVDSLTPLPLLKQDGGFLLDLGSGGGFPGLPLKIMLPKMHVFLVDASRKKTSFLSNMVRMLDLTETSVLRERIEELAEREDFKGQFDTVISRAALKLDQLLIFSAFFLKNDGRLVAMKGADATAEIKTAEATAAAVGMTFSGEAPQDASTKNSLKKIVIYKRL